MKRKLTPVHGKVFVKRNDPLNEVAGIKVSEGALTKNLIGVITAIEENKYVEVGDVIHLPHFGVEDVEFDGEEYAVIHEDDLFLKYVNGEAAPINRYVLVKKCVNDHYRDDDGEIFMHKTDKQIEYTHYVQIEQFAEDCNAVSKEDIGSFFIAPEEDERLRRIEYSKEFMAHEDLIQFTLVG